MFSQLRNTDNTVQLIVDDIKIVQLQSCISFFDIFILFLIWQ